MTRKVIASHGAALLETDDRPGEAAGFATIWARRRPSRRGAGWHWIRPGSLLATLLWLAASPATTPPAGRLAPWSAS